MSDEMPDEPQHNRRWEDIQNAIYVAVKQALTSIQLTVDRLDDDVQGLKGTVYGNPATHQRGMVDRLDKIEEQIAQLGEKLGGQIATVIEEGKARGNQIAGARMALYVLAGIIAFVGGLPALATFLKALGITP